jgi:hypothetical protein
MNTTHYYFAEKCLKEAFIACKAAIFSELTSSKAIELERNVIVEDLIADHIEENKIFAENEITIENGSQLKDQVAFLITEFNVDLVNIYITESDIQQRINVIIEELSESEEDHIIKDFSIEFVVNSNAETLFNVMFSRQSKLENVSNDENEVENIIDYEDYDYTLIFDKINDCLEFTERTGFDYEYDHTGGDVGNNEEYLEFYYKFTKK